MNTLPPHPEAGQIARPAALPAATETYRILFVDDEPAVLDGIRRSLHTVASPVRELHFASSPAEALALVRARTVHAVISDMHMPGMNGAELLRRISTLSPDCIRIMLTGQADLETALAAVNEGHVFRLLAKPCSRSELFNVLDQAMRQHALQTAERRLLQAQLEHAQKLAAVGQFAAGIVHDVNNVLSCIAALSDENLGRNRAESLQQINDAAMQAAMLTRDLMNFCRRDEDQPVARIDVDELMGSVQRLVAPMLGHPISLRVDTAPGLPALSGHIGRLRQAITNLVINARDAIAERGAVLITVRECVFSESEAAARPGARAGRFVCFSVKDDGCGMSEATQRKIFEPFFTTKAEGHGTGLGLSLVRQLVAQHHGWLSLESQPGEGSTFHIFVPVPPS